MSYLYQENKAADFHPLLSFESESDKKKYAKK